MNRGVRLEPQQIGDELILRKVETDLDDNQTEEIICATGAHRALRLEDIGTETVIPFRR